jgi:hypothetical protein
MLETQFTPDLSPHPNFVSRLPVETEPSLRTSPLYYPQLQHLILRSYLQRHLSHLNNVNP